MHALHEALQEAVAHTHALHEALQEAVAHTHALHEELQDSTTAKESADINLIHSINYAIAYSPASCVAPIVLIQFLVASINSD